MRRRCRRSGQGRPLGGRIQCEKTLSDDEVAVSAMSHHDSPLMGLVFVIASQPQDLDVDVSSALLDLGSRRYMRWRDIKARFYGFPKRRPVAAPSASVNSGDEKTEAANTHPPSAGWLDWIGYMLCCFRTPKVTLRIRPRR
jgi:hypothetical protein